MKNSSNKKGFTLIELLVVIAIIGILSGIVLVSLGGARSKARDAKRQSDIQQVVVAQEMYYNDTEAYFATGTSNGVPTISTYLNAFDDPQTTKHYVWLTNTGNAQYFCVYAALESGSIFAASEKGTKLLPSTATPTVSTACF